MIEVHTRVAKQLRSDGMTTVHIVHSMKLPIDFTKPETRGTWKSFRDEFEAYFVANRNEDIDDLLMKYAYA